MVEETMDSTLNIFDDVLSPLDGKVFLLGKVRNKRYPGSGVVIITYYV